MSTVSVIVCLGNVVILGCEIMCARRMLIVSNATSSMSILSSITRGSVMTTIVMFAVSILALVILVPLEILWMIWCNSFYRVLEVVA